MLAAVDNLYMFYITSYVIYQPLVMMDKYVTP